MNGLSWTLYLADVSANVQGISIGGAIISGMTTVALGIVAAVSVSVYPDDDDRARAKYCMSKIWVAASAVVAFAIFAAVLPSRNTIMLIAASEVGETLLASQPAQELGGEAGQLATDSLRLLHKYVQEQLGDTKAEGGK